MASPRLATPLAHRWKRRIARTMRLCVLKSTEKTAMASPQDTLNPRRYLSHYTLGRDNNFNLLRLVAATLVLITHSFALSIGRGDAEPLRASLGTTLGAIAVDVFFVTSGFLVTGSLLYRRSLREFIAARFLRIYPALWVALALTVIVVGLFFTTLSLGTFLADKLTWKYLARNATLLTNIVYLLPGAFVDVPMKDAVNGSLWTLPEEIKMYLILAGLWMLALLAKVNPARWVAVACVSLGVLGVCSTLVLFVRGTNTIDTTLVTLGAMFFAGAALRVLQERVVVSHPVALGLFAALLLSATLDRTMFGVLYRLAAPYLVLYLALVPAGSIRRFNAFGDYSYGMYIYAFPVQQALAHVWRGINPYQMMAASFVITLALAAVSWHLIEERALALKGRLRRA